MGVHTAVAFVPVVVQMYSKREVDTNALSFTVPPNVLFGSWVTIVKFVNASVPNAVAAGGALFGVENTLNGIGTGAIANPGLRVGSVKKVVGICATLFVVPALIENACDIFALVNHDPVTRLTPRKLTVLRYDPPVAI